MTITEAKKLLEEKKLTSVELVQSCLGNIAKKEKDVHAFLEVFADEALEQAKAVDQARAAGEELGPLAGIPIAIKNNQLIKGKKATAGSQILENYTASYDATVIERLLAAGAILIGRTNLDEFAMGSSTETSHFGTTQNPWNLSRVPGGSSGGSAAAVAAGFALGATGSDTGGSIRQPASLCGVVGIKPTYGRVSRYGLIAFASSLDQIGVFARTVEDAALLLQTIEGKDSKDATSVDLPDTTIAELLKLENINDLKIGLPKEYFIDGMDPKVEARVREAVKLLQSHGAQIIEISLPHTQYALATYYILAPSEASSNLERFDGMRFGHRQTGKTLTDTYKKTRGEGFGAEVKRRIILGTFALSAGYYDAYYKKALAVRSLIRQDFDEAFKKVDVIVTPTSPSVAWPIGEKFNDPLAMYLADIFTVPLNLAGLPGISIPCGFRDDLPVGLQIISKAFDEEALFRVGHFYQSVTDWHQRTPGS